jgi:phthalate 4,5-dioxygenase oxygenase subunit
VLSAEDNEILTRVGPGTQMGNLLRRYWIPACLSAEIAEPDGPPARCDCSARTWSRSGTPTGGSD